MDDDASDDIRHFHIMYSEKLQLYVNTIRLTEKLKCKHPLLTTSELKIQTLKLLSTFMITKMKKLADVMEKSCTTSCSKLSMVRTLCSGQT